MKHTAKTEHRQSNHNGGTMTTPSFNTILNPSTGKMVLSGGRVGSKLIKNYTADKILNPKSNKLVMTGGKVGKNVLETYKNGYLKGVAKLDILLNEKVVDIKKSTPAAPAPVSPAPTTNPPSAPTNQPASTNPPSPSPTTGPPVPSTSTPSPTGGKKKRTYKKE